MNDKPPIAVVGLGAGGHAKVVIEILRADARYQIVGLLDNSAELEGRSISGLPVLGSDTQLRDLISQGVHHFFMGVGGASTTLPRRRLFEFALRAGAAPVSAIHPRAVISESAQLGDGLTVMAGAIINACARIGVNVIINSGSIVEHDAVIGDHVHIATGARLAGMVTVGEGAHIGLGASIRQRIRIGERAVVGAGAVVVADVPDDTIVVGVPARPLRKIDG